MGMGFLTPVGKEFFKPLGWVGTDTVKDVAKIGERIDPKPLARHAARIHCVRA